MDICFVSHPLCPYTHRLRIIAAMAGWNDGREYRTLDLAYATLPAAALAHSPAGELPSLVLDGRFAGSDPVAIAEFLDGSTKLGLLPTDPLARLAVREGERRVGELLDTMREMFGGATGEQVRRSLDSVFEQLAVIDADLAADGTDASTARMDVVALGPVFALLMFFSELRDDDRWSAMPRLMHLGMELLANDAVRATLTPSYAEEFEAFFRMTESAFPRVVLGRTV